MVASEESFCGDDTGYSRSQLAYKACALDIQLLGKNCFALVELEILNKLLALWPPCQRIAANRIARDDILDGRQSIPGILQAILQGALIKVVHRNGEGSAEILQRLNKRPLAVSREELLLNSHERYPEACR